MSVYSTPKTNINGLCVFDFPYPRRVLSDLSITGKNNMTIENCSEICKNYEFFGLQNGDECRCGNKATQLMPTYPSSCNKRCTGDNTQICGGNWRLTVHKNELVTTKPVEPASSSVLVLSTMWSTSRPMVVNSTGQLSNGNACHDIQFFQEQ